MPRALATHGIHYPADQREDVKSSLRARRSTLQSLGCNYWVFEDPDAPGLIIEFYEAGDAATLQHARAAVGVDARGHAILTEVEL